MLTSFFWVGPSERTVTLTNGFFTVIKFIVLSLLKILKYFIATHYEGSSWLNELINKCIVFSRNQHYAIASNTGKQS